MQSHTNQYYFRVRECEFRVVTINRQTCSTFTIRRTITPRLMLYHVSPINSYVQCRYQRQRRRRRQRRNELKFYSCDVSSCVVVTFIPPVNINHILPKWALANNNNNPMRRDSFAPHCDAVDASRLFFPFGDCATNNIGRCNANTITIHNIYNIVVHVKSHRKHRNGSPFVYPSCYVFIALLFQYFWGGIPWNISPFNLFHCGDVVIVVPVSRHSFVCLCRP